MNFYILPSWSPAERQWKFEEFWWRLFRFSRTDRTVAIREVT